MPETKTGGSKTYLAQKQWQTYRRNLTQEARVRKKQSSGVRNLKQKPGTRSDSESEPALLTCGVKPGRGRSKAARGQADQNRTTQYNETDGEEGSRTRGDSFKKAEVERGS